MPRLQVPLTVVKVIIDLWCHAPQMFRMILSSVSKTFQNILVLKIYDEGFMVNQHSKSITEPWFELQLHLALQLDIFQKVLFVEKDSCGHHLYNGTLGTFLAFIRAEVWQFPPRGIFSGFWALSKPWHSWLEESCKICRKYPCIEIVIAQPP